ncbi:hypothetical protein ACQP1P_25480 [Dactylosporangium sp. CA-052675]|uniref:hypothetical protein n=1 Tax=Dactylosporangium sp. CA-052675 TaxID=3239927 RepID=UPI003D9360D2
MIEFFSRNRGPISLLIGGLGLFILALVLASRAVRRAGGWKAVLRQGRREVALTGAALVRPVRAWLRYRRNLRRLTRALADPTARGTVRRALQAAATGPAQPYAVLVGPAAAGVLLAGRDPGTAPEPFTADEHDPRLWWADLADLAGLDGEGAGEPVVLGIAQRDLVVHLDLDTGPPLTAGAGDPRTARALIQAMAAQLDRARPGRVQVTAGVHPRFPGAGPTPDTMFVVCPEPPGEPVGRGVRVLAVRGAHGHARLVTTERGGRIRIAGVPLDIDTAALPKAVARLLRSAPPASPPVLPPAVSLVERPGERTEFAELAEVAELAEFAEEPAAVTGVSAHHPATAVTGVPAQQPTTVDEFAEPAFDDAAVGRRSGGTA